MCNTEYSQAHSIPAYAVCSCGAMFHDCKDDRKKKQEHITALSNPNHKWVFLKEGVNGVKNS